jgi:phage gpG-like protein
VDTGNLMNSYSAGTQKIKPDGSQWMVGTNSDYAIPLEFGHHTKSGTFVAARPHLTPSAERERPLFIKRMSKLEEQLK